MSERRRNYELIFALTPVSNESEAATIVQNISDYIQDLGGEVSEQETWGIRRLAFPINNYQEGQFQKLPGSGMLEETNFLSISSFQTFTGTGSSKQVNTLSNSVGLQAPKSID